MLALGAHCHSFDHGSCTIRPVGCDMREEFTHPSVLDAVKVV
jgi:hypothetical protein